MAVRWCGNTGIPALRITISVILTKVAIVFLGLVNSDDPEGAVWTGSNETGFSSMNTASYNLKDDDIKEMDQEGNLMQKA